MVLFWETKVILWLIAIAIWPAVLLVIVTIISLKMSNVEIVYKRTDEWYIEGQRVTANDNEWQRVVQRVKMSDKEWQRMAMSDSKWEQWYSKWKRHSALQRMDDCHHFHDKKRYTATSRDGWLQLEWLNK